MTYALSGCEVSSATSTSSRPSLSCWGRTMYSYTSHTIRSFFSIHLSSLCPCRSPVACAKLNVYNVHKNVRTCSLINLLFAHIQCVINAQEILYFKKRIRHVSMLDSHPAVPVLTGNHPAAPVLQQQEERAHVRDEGPPGPAAG